MNIDQIFKEYKVFVEHVLNSYINDYDEAKDLANVVFLKVYQNLSKFDGANIGAWIRTIANNTAIDYLRRKNKKEVLTPENDDEGLALENFGDGTEDEVVEHMMYLQVLEEIEKLPRKKRNVFRMFYVENMTVSDISKALDIPPGTVKAILSRTRNKMIKKFRKWEQQLCFCSEAL